MPRDTPYRSRRALLDLLKQEGAQDAACLGRRLGISAMAVRQHLYELRADGLADYREEPRPKGRPAKLWHLTAAADRFFPDGHAELTTGLLAAMQNAFGADGMEKLLETRGRQQIESYGAEIDRNAPLARRLEILVELRSAEGYMAALEPQADGSYLLVENHCPICAAATACSGLCRAELAVFRAVLGDGVVVERRDHILAGARRCAYHVGAE